MHRAALAPLTLGAAAVAVLAGVAYSMSHKHKRRSLSEEEWQQALQECGTIAGFDGIVEAILDRGVDPCIRADVWPFLLEVFDHDSTFAQRHQQHQLMTKQYQQLLLQCQAYEAVLKESLRPLSPTAVAPAAAAAAEAAAAVANGSVQHEQQEHGSNGNPRQQPPPQQQQQQQQQQLPEQVRQFGEAHRVIVIDAVRTDFQKHAAALQRAQGAAAGADDCQPQTSDGSSWAGSNDGRPVSSSNGSSAGQYGGPVWGSGGGSDAPAAAAAAGAPGVAALAAGLVTQGLNTLQQWQQYWLYNLLGGQAAAWGHTQALWVSEATQLVLDSSPHMRNDSKRQASRMIAMLSAYALHDPDTGYCQGMSDLLLPFLLLMDDDALVFWCFVAFMQHLGARHNFSVDERGIFGQLQRLSQVLAAADKPLMYRLHQLGAAECHFGYRMVVVLMRRDMPLPKVMQLWEVLWAHAWQQRREHRRLHAGGAAVHGGASKDGAQGTTVLVADSTRTLVGSKHGKQGPASLGAAAGADAAAGAEQPDLPHAQLFVCFVAAVIMAQRRHILSCHDADDVLRLCHGLKHVDVWACLERARLLLAEQQRPAAGSERALLCDQQPGVAGGTAVVVQDYF